MVPDDPQWVLLGVLPPAVILGAITLAIALLLSKLAPRLSAAAQLIALIAAWVTGTFIILGLPDVPPRLEMDWLFIAILPAAALIAVGSTLTKHQLAWWFPRLILYPAVPILTIWGTNYIDPDNDNRLFFIAIPAAALLILRLLFAFRGDADRTRHRAAALGVTAIATGALLLMLAAPGAGQSAIVLGGSLIATAVALFITPSKSLKAPVEDLALPVIAMLALSGFFYADLSTRHTITIAAALAAWSIIGLIPILNKLPIIKWAARWIALAAILAWPLIEAAIEFARASAETYDY